ncbi:MAG: FHA domain-containing protein [Chthonomonadales bacterium]
MEPTRAMQAPADVDRTQVAGAPGPVGVTQMAPSVVCPVCRTSNPPLEIYCTECGFLLASTPGMEEQLPEEPGGLELVEAGGGRRFRVRPGANMVGREMGEILLMDSTVSRRHAQITLSQGEVTVTDLNSTNGTFVDGRRIPPGEATGVALGAALRFGNVVLTLVEPGAEPAAVAEAGKGAIGAAEATQAMPALSDTHPASAKPGITMARSPEALLSEEALSPVARLHAAGGAAEPVDLYPGPTTIGRRTSNDVVIAGDPFISGRHAQIECDDTGCYVTDLNSTNGTLLNGVKLDAGVRTRMEDGDELTIGQGTYRLEIIAARMEHAVSTVEATGEDASAPRAEDSQGEHAE